MDRERSTPLTPNELKTLKLKNEEVAAKERALSFRKAEEREVRDKARRAAQHSSRRAAAQNSTVPGIDKRWGWLEEQMFVDIRSAVYPGACVAPPPLALSARKRSARASSPNSSRSSRPHTGMPHGAPRSPSPRGPSPRSHGPSPGSPSLMRRLQANAHEHRRMQR